MAFQHTAFQNDAFQLGPTIVLPPKLGAVDKPTVFTLRISYQSVWSSSIALLTAIVQLPFTQVDWPNPPRSAVPSISLRTHIDQTKILLIGQDKLPFRQSDWPVPKGAARASDLVTWFNPGLGPRVVRPQTNYDWPVPKGSIPSISLSTYLDPFKVLLHPPIPNSQLDWPVPTGYARGISLRTHLDSTRIHLIGQDKLPLNQKDWPNPNLGPARSIDRLTWTSTFQLSDRLDQAVPQAQYDWPVPKGYVPGISLRTHLDPLKLNLFGKDTIYGAPGQVPSYDWQNPRGRFIFADFTSPTPFTLFVESGLPPPRQSDWPNPVIQIPRSNPDWVVGLPYAIRAAPVIHLGPGFVEIDPTKQWAPVDETPRRHIVERHLDRQHLRQIIERAYAGQKQPVDSIVEYLTLLALEGQIMPAEYLALLYAQLPGDLIDVNSVVALVQQEMYRRRIEIEERDMEAILLALGDL